MRSDAVHNVRWREEVNADCTRALCRGSHASRQGKKPCGQWLCFRRRASEAASQRGRRSGS